MRVVVFFIMIVLALTGCRTVHPVAETVRTVKDSTWTEVKFHKKDTTITIPGAVTVITIPIEDITATPVRKSSGRATVSVSRSGDNIECECECAEEHHRIELLEKEISHLQKIVELQKETRTEYEKYVPWYIKVLAWIGGVFLVLIVGRIALKSIKPKL